MPQCHLHTIHFRFTLPVWQAIAACWVVLVAQTTFAQTGWQFELWLRPQGTELVNTTEEQLDDAVNERRSSWGMATGGGAGWGLGNRWAVWTGMAYSLQQQDYGSRSLLLNGNEQRVLRELRIEYVQFPIRVEYRPWVGERLQVQLGAGAFAAGLVRVTERDNDRRYREWPPPSVHFSQYPPRSATLKAWHFGLHARAGFAFKLRYNLWAFAHIALEYALDDVEDKSASFLWTEAGVTERMAYYDERHRPEFGPDRAVSRWLVLGGQLGLRYHILRSP